MLGGVKKEPVKAKAPLEMDDLEMYLADTDVPDIDDDILKWWRVKELKWPRLAKMVKQYFSDPALSAGVHTDLKKSAKDTTLEHSLFAAFNTD